MHLLREIASHSPDFLDLAENITPQGIRGITSFIALYDEVNERFETSSISDALTFLIEKIDYKKTLFDEVKTEKGREFKWENVQECVRGVQAYEAQDEATSLEDFVAGAMLDQNKRHRKEGLAADKLNLMTFHSAKGLEFPAVFLIGMEDHLIPHSKSQSDAGIEEERRLLYVAITRAMQDLCLSMAQKRLRHGKVETATPSRFLYEIPKEILRVTSWRFH